MAWRIPGLPTFLTAPSFPFFFCFPLFTEFCRVSNLVFTPKARYRNLFSVNHYDNEH